MSTTVLDRPVSTGDVVAAWREYRAAVAEHNAAIVASGPQPDLDRFPANIRWIHLDTHRPMAIARYAYLDVVADYRAAHPRPTAEGAAYVAKRGSAHEAKCPTHPRFRRIAWSGASVPAQSCRDHNVEHHGGAPVIVKTVPDLEPSTLLP